MSSIVFTVFFKDAAQIVCSLFVMSTILVRCAVNDSSESFLHKQRLAHVHLQTVSHSVNMRKLRASRARSDILA